MLALASPLAGAAAEAGPPTFRLTGRVVDAADQPVAEAAVECYQRSLTGPSRPGPMEWKQRVTTSTNGVFELSLTNGYTVLLVRKPGLALGWKQVWDLNRDAEVRIVLTPPARLAGVVVDEAGQPVPEAEVFVSDAAVETVWDLNYRRYDYLSDELARRCFSTRTKADGRFRLEGFPTNAAIGLVASKPGKAMRKQSPARLGPGDLPHLPGQDDIRLELVPAARLEGKVVVADTGQPLAGVQLWLALEGGPVVGETVSGHGDAAGMFVFTNLSAGSYRLNATFGTNALPEWVAQPVALELQAGQTLREVQVAATQGGLLQVTLDCHADPQLAVQANVGVYANTFHAQGTTDADGTVLFRLPTGTFQVAVSKNGLSLIRDSPSALVEAGRTNRLSLTLEPPPKITGLVRDPNNQPAPDLPVRVIPSHRASPEETRTDAHGRFTFLWRQDRYAGADSMACAVARDLPRNLAAAQDFDQDSRALDLRLAPGFTLAGRVQDPAGRPLAKAGVALWMWAGQASSALDPTPAATDAQGRFEWSALPPGRRYTLRVFAPGHGTVVHQWEDKTSPTNRVELPPIVLPVANLPMAGRVFDSEQRPVAGASIQLYGEGQPNLTTRSDREGRFHFGQVCAGPAQLFAQAGGDYGNLTARGGDTNLVLILGQRAGAKTYRVRGTVLDPDGKPAAGVALTVFPKSGGLGARTDAQGAFSLTWHLESWMAREGASALLVAREPRRGLAGAEELTEDTTNLTVHLKPAVTLLGRVQTPEGQPIAQAEVNLWLLVNRVYSDVEDQPVRTGADGRFRIPTLPAGLQYQVYARAKDRGRCAQEVATDSDAREIELEPFILKPADHVVAGQVLDAEEKPVPGARVSLSGEDQPEGHTTTDKQGRFSLKACEGTARLYAYDSRGGYASASVEAGETNLVLVLTQSGVASDEAPRRPALKGKPLPDLALLGFAPEAAPAGRPVLLCALDVEQRPSRRVARLLAAQQEALAQQGLTVLVVLVPGLSPEAVKAWQAEQPVPFALGRLPDTTAKSPWAGRFESLPSFLLTDKSGRVVAEDLAWEELAEQLEALTK